MHKHSSQNIFVESLFTYVPLIEPINIITDLVCGDFDQAFNFDRTFYFIITGGRWRLDVHLLVPSLEETYKQVELFLCLSSTTLKYVFSIFITNQRAIKLCDCDNTINLCVCFLN